MFRPLRILRDRSAVRFAIVGLCNTGFGLLIIYLSIWLLGLGDIVANVIGYACGISLSFVLNATWSFEYRGDICPAFAKFILVILAAYLSNLLAVVTAIEIFELNNYLAHAMGIVPYALVGYFGSRFVVFVASTEKQE